MITVHVNLELYNLMPQLPTLFCFLGAYFVVSCTAAVGLQAFISAVFQAPPLPFLPRDPAGVITTHNTSRSLPFPPVNLVLLLILCSLFLFLS